MNKITVCVFTCDKYRAFWKHNVSFLRDNIPSDSLESIILVTDMPTDAIIDGASVVVANDNNDFLLRFKCGVSCVSTDYFLLMLDDYFLIKPLSSCFLNSCISFFRSNTISYCKLYCRNKKYLTSKLTKNFVGINPLVQYSVDLYPGIWNKEFAIDLINSWDSSKRTIWDFEANLYKQKIFCQSSNKFVFCTTKDFVFLDVVRKGKILRHSYSFLKKHGIVFDGWQKRSVFESAKDHAMVFLSHHLPVKLKNKLKNKLKRKGALWGD